MISHGKVSTFIPVCAAAMMACGAVVTAAPAFGDEGGAVLSQINATRAATGCGPVAPNPQLTASAARHANDMLRTGVQAHTGSDGSSVVQRVTDAGYTSFEDLGEIVFWANGPGGSPAAAVNWWMNSPGHRAVITDCGMTDAGFSAVRSGSMLTVTGDFAKR
ncbi:CAP domain-containing protein [Mycobacterium sp. NPDC051804]|uniref:CAP domain-containing protein n=1 Tax=Mycobacterium sp. NPDC051804 TaxID=3364295 RepID=UPI003792616A